MIPIRIKAKLPWGWRPYPAPVTPPCAVCGSERRRAVGRRVSFGMRYTNVVCVDCGLVYLAPRPDAAAFHRFYEELYPRLYPKTDVTDGPTERGREVVAFLREHGALTGRRGVLDAGCGDGGLVGALLEDGAGGAAVSGCDPGWQGSPEIHHSGRHAPIFQADIEDIADELARHDVVLMYDVLEHLLDPAGTLRLLRRACGDDGLLFVSTSCLDNWRDIPPHGWENYYLRLAHTFTFTRHSLANLLAVSGWHVEEWRAAPRGDQWVLARAGEARAAQTGTRHAAEVDELIASYRARCQA